MNTSRKGDDFETRFYDAIKKELDRGRLGLSPPSCKLFRQKGYYSRDRKKEIVFDVCIEMFVSGADQWSLLWLWECKDYKTSIPVDDVEEFWAKLEQVGGVNVKGGIASSSAFQVSALRFADSKGISVVRILPEDQIRWIFYATGSGRYTTTDEYYEAFTLPKFVGESSDFYALSQAHLFQDFSGTLKHVWLEAEGEQTPRLKEEPFVGNSVEPFRDAFRDTIAQDTSRFLKQNVEMRTLRLFLEWRFPELPPGLTPRHLGVALELLKAARCKDLKQLDDLLNETDGSRRDFHREMNRNVQDSHAAGEVALAVALTHPTLRDESHWTAEGLAVLSRVGG